MKEGGALPYVEEVCEAGCTIEKNKYYTCRYNADKKGETRGKKEKPTGEAQKRVNNRQAIKKLRRLMNTNFKDGDFLVRLDFHEMREISSVQMQEMISKALRNIRGKNKTVKYIYVKEVGPHGGRHIHMMISKMDADIIRMCWPHGGIHIDPLISHGQYAKVAEYFVKYSNRTEQTEGQLIGKRWYASRNLKKPVIRKRVIMAHRFREDIKVKKGYYLDKDSVASGVSELTGFEWFSYTLIKTDKEGGGG